MTDLLPITRQDMLGCAERELEMRRKVYPRWVSAGKMKQAKADREIELMAAIVNELRGGVAESNGRLAP